MGGQRDGRGSVGLLKHSLCFLGSPPNKLFAPTQTVRGTGDHYEPTLEWRRGSTALGARELGSSPASTVGRLRSPHKCLVLSAHLTEGGPGLLSITGQPKEQADPNQTKGPCSWSAFVETPSAAAWLQLNKAICQHQEERWAGSITAPLCPDPTQMPDARNSL